MTIEDRLERAGSFRALGYNCAQCVILAFPDITGMDDATAQKVSIGLGGGCGSGELCGVVSAMALVVGMMSPGGANDKKQVYADMRTLHDDFVGRFGSCVCCELKIPGKPIPCNDLITTGIQMLHDKVTPCQKCTS